ncbi:MAG: FAD-binding oxidoreductase [Robiginitomaculum sp.]|nr:FAD-binding oxidoreductase [Robiginitomaculum sp.]
MNEDYDIAIIGGGFYGCCLAQFLSSISLKTCIVEAGSSLMNRASRVNQARVHTGFHYPRSFVTALRSLSLHQRFTEDFSKAIISDFEMLYAIPSRGSKVTSKRFFRTFSQMGAPIEPASQSQKSLFDTSMIDDVFKCREYAFNWQLLLEIMRDNLENSKVKILLGETVEKLSRSDKQVCLELQSGKLLRANTVFNMTYANINHLLKSSGIKPVALKHELTEIALIKPPEELQNLAVTVMDGFFFSSLPYPPTKLHSFTHVRYTPYKSWVDAANGSSPYEVLNQHRQTTSWRHMLLDAKRYLPCLHRAQYQQSMFEVKTVLIQNEHDDGRPILFCEHSDFPNLFSVLGSKIDNIYDLFQAVSQARPQWKDAEFNLPVGRD